MVESYLIYKLLNWSFLCGRKKSENQNVDTSETNHPNQFYDTHRKLICHNKWRTSTLGISPTPQRPVWSLFHARHCTKSTPVFIPTDGEVNSIPH